MARRKSIRLKSPEKDLLASLGLVGYGLQDVEVPEQAEAIGYDTIIDNDGQGNYTEVKVVYFTDRRHTEEFGDLEYFDEHEDAMEYGQKVSQYFGLPFLGRYDAEDSVEQVMQESADAIDAEPVSSMERNTEYPEGFRYYVEESNNVIETADGEYRNQETQYRKVFTLNELYRFWDKEYGE